MRCEVCGRPIKNAELWRLAETREAPRARSLMLVCAECQREAARIADALSEWKRTHLYGTDRKSA